MNHIDYDRATIEKLKEKIDKLTPIQHEEIYKFIIDDNIKHTKSPEGVYIISTEIKPDTYQKIFNYINFCENLETIN